MTAASKSDNKLTVEASIARVYEPTNFAILIELLPVKCTTHYGGSKGIVNYETGMLETEGGFQLAIPQRDLDELKQREQNAMCFGTVLKVAPEAWDWTQSKKKQVKVGDTVIIPKFVGFDLPHPLTREKNNLRVVRDEDIQGTINLKELGYE